MMHTSHLIYTKKSKLHKPNYTYCNELELIEEQLNNNKINCLNIEQILKSLDQLKYEFEKILFSNKTIIFLKDYGGYKQTFLLIIEDEYVRKSNIFNESNILTRDILTFRLLKSQIDTGVYNAVMPGSIFRRQRKYKYKTEIQETVRVTLMPYQYESIVSSNYENYSIMISSFHKIDSKALSNLTNLKEIDYSNNVNG